MEATNKSRGRRLASGLARRWLVVIAVPLIFGAAVYFSERGDQPRYQSTASVLLQTNDLGAVLAGVSDTGNADPARAVATERVIASVPEVRRRAIQALGATGEPIGDSATIAFDSADSFTNGDADVLDVKVTADTPAFAESLATEVARQYIAFRAEVANGQIQQARNQVRTRMAQLRGDPSASAEYAALVDKAEKLDTLLLLGSDRARLLAAGDQASQVAPKPVQRAIVAAVLGLLLGALLALLAERLDKSVRSEDEIAERLGVPLLARLPDPRRLPRLGTVVALANPQGAETEAFRLLRANLRFGLLSREGHSVAVTSAREGEGKTFVAANLAVVAAAAGARVVLVDLDLRRPSVHRVFETERQPGVPDVLTGGSTLEDALVQVPLPARFAQVGGGTGSLQLLCAGTQTPNPGELAGSIALRDLLNSLEGRFDLVIVDTPPTTVVPDAIPVAAAASGTIAVVRAPEARRPALDGLRDALESAGSMMGVVLTAAWRSPASYEAYTRETVPQVGEDGRGAADRPSSSVLRFD